MSCALVKNKNQNGQALVEYVLMLMVLAGLSALLGRFMPSILAKLESPLKHDFRMVYKYGDPKTCGFDEEDGAPCGGAPVNHPRYDFPGNFKLFGRSKQ